MSLLAQHGHFQVLKSYRCLNTNKSGLSSIKKACPVKNKLSPATSKIAVTITKYFCIEFG